MLLLILLSILAGNVCIFAQDAPSDSELTRNVKNSVHKLNVDFTKILLNEVKPEGNFIFSPLNIHGALALVHLGATGTTKSELSKVCGLPVEESKLSEAHQNLGKLLNDIQNATFDSAKVTIANGVFAQKGLQLKNEYSKATANYYKSEALQVDFAKPGSEATDTVNKWVADNTKNRITKLFKEEISKDTIILLASTLYFAGKWSKSFHKADTETKNFNTGAKVVQVPMMSINESVPYFDDKNSKFEAISIPYLYGDFSMLIILPYRDQSVKTLINSLTPEQLSAVINSLQNTYVNYQIPRLKFHWSQDINQHLAKLGVKQMFEKAELGNLVDLKNIAVSKVTHAAEIEVNEEGTVASAVTAIQMVLMSLPHYINPPVPFHADRPFLFSIYHRETGVILFTGLVQNPADANV